MNSAALEPDLRALYRETVLAHSRAPHHFGTLDHPDRVARGHNPLCGDKISLYLQIGDERIAALRHETVGCAICVASASIMTDALNGHQVDDALAAADTVLREFSLEQREQPVRGPGEMAALSGVREYPSRIKCATLPWKTLAGALRGADTAATTEQSEQED